MCDLCDEMANDIIDLRVRLKRMGHGKKPVKQPIRNRYYKKYYQDNRDKKLAAANDRNRKMRETGSRIKDGT